MQEKIIAIWNGCLYQKMRNTWLTFYISVCILCSFLQQKQHKKLTSLYSLHHKVPSNKTVDQWHTDKCKKSIKKETNMKSSTHHPCQPWWLPRQGHNVTKFYLSPTHTPLFWHYHWLPCPINTFFCMLIGPRALQFIIYSPRSFDIQYFCIYYSQVLLNEENNLVY